METTLLVYAATFESATGGEHEARACGRPLADGRWEAWIELRPRGGGAPVRTPRETTQPDRAALLWWAQGLSRVYLEGAFARAVPSASASASAPAAAPIHAEPARERDGVLDPFAVYAHGQSLLRRQLEGLSASHLHRIATAHGMLDDGEPPLAKEALVDRIVRETALRAGAGESRAAEHHSPFST